MEIVIDDDYDFEVDFSKWTNADKLSLIDDMLGDRKTEIRGYLSATIEVEPPEYDRD